MHTLLSTLVSRPAASITDADVAAAIEAQVADDRVTKAVAAGRDDLNRPMIDFEMTSFAAVCTLGRAIGAIAEADKKLADAAAKAAAKAAAAGRKEAKIEKAAEIVETAEALTGDETLVEIVSWKDFFAARQRELGRRIEERTPESPQLHREWVAQKRDAEIRNAAISAAKEARQAAHIAGLTGTPAQIEWAADIRAALVSQMSDEDREVFMSPVAATVWIDARHQPVDRFVLSHRGYFDRVRAAS